MQTSPISFVESGKGPFSACNKENRRRLHAGNEEKAVELLPCDKQRALRYVMLFSGVVTARPFDNVKTKRKNEEMTKN